MKHPEQEAIRFARGAKISDRLSLQDHLAHCQQCSDLVLFVQKVNNYVRSKQARTERPDIDRELEATGLDRKRATELLRVFANKPSAPSKVTLLSSGSGARGIAATLATETPLLDKASEHLRLKMRAIDGVALIDCHGRIAFGEEATLLRKMAKLILARNISKVVINLSHVTEIDSGGWGALVRMRHLFVAKGGAIRLVGLKRKPLAAFEAIGLIDLFEVYDRVEQAVQSLQ